LKPLCGSAVRDVERLCDLSNAAIAPESHHDGDAVFSRKPVEQVLNLLRLFSRYQPIIVRRPNALCDALPRTR